MFDGVTRAEIALALEAAEFKKGMDEVKGIIGNAAETIQGFAKGAAMALSGLGALTSLISFKNMIEGAIDARANMYDLSIKTGVAVEQLSALAKVGKYTGASADEIGMAMNRMAKNIASTSEEGKGAAEALRALGINFDAFRSMTPDQQMLTVAQSMNTFKDGGEKAAVAMMLLGRGGAELLPFLQRLGEQHQLVGGLTTESAKAAKDYENNLITLAAVGDEWKKQLVNDIVPALVSVTSQLIDGRKAYGGFMAATLDIGMNVDPMKSLGQNIADTRGQIEKTTARMAELNASQESGSLYSTIFSKSIEAEKKVIVDNLKTLESRDQYLKSTQTRDALKSIVGLTDEHRFTTEKATLSLGNHSKALIADAKSVKEAKDQYAPLIAASAAHVAEMQAQLEGTDKLTAGEKKQFEMEEKIIAGTMDYTAAGYEAASAQLLLEHNLELATRAHDAQEKAIFAAVKAHESEYSAIVKATASIDDQIATQKLANLSTAAGIDFSGQISIAKLREQATTLELMAIKVEDKNLDFELGEQYRANAEALRKLAAEKEKNPGLQAARDTLNAWTRTTDQIGQGLTDALTHGFKSGWTYIEHMAKAEAIKFVLQPVMGAVLGGIGSLLPGSAAAQGMGGASEIGGMANLGSLFGAGGVMSTVGTFGATGFMSTVTGTGLGTTLGAAGSLMEGGSVAGGLGMGLGAVAPYVLAAAALYSALNKQATPHVGGYAMGNADGSVTDITQQQGGIEFAQSQTAVAQLAKLTAGLLNSSSATFGGAGGYSVRSVFESDNNDPSWGLFHLLQNGAKSAGSFDALGTLNKDSATGFAEYAGMAAEGVRTALESLDLPKWASQALDALGDAPGIDKLAEAVTQINTMQKALIDMGTSVQGLGGPFDQVAALSSDAKNQLAQFTGGIDAFITKTRGYVSSYYTEGEQMAIQARDVLKQLGAVGIVGNAATTKGDLRTLMESLDPNKEADRKQMAALLNVASEYASVGAYLEKEHLTLGQLADQSPQVAAISQLQNPTETTANATQETATTVKDVATNTEETTAAVKEVVDGQANVVAVLQDGFMRMLDQLEVITEGINKLEEDQRIALARSS